MYPTHTVFEFFVFCCLVDRWIDSGSIGRNMFLFTYPALVLWCFSVACLSPGTSINRNTEVWSFTSCLQVFGLAFLVLGLWLRFSGNTRAIFQVEELNSSAFVMCELVFYSNPYPSVSFSDMHSLIVSLISCEPGVTVLIVLGTVMVILVMFGDYGACNEKRTALQVVRLFPPTQELPPLLYVVAKSVSTLVFISTDEITKFTLHLTEAIVWELHRTALLDSLSLT